MKFAFITGHETVEVRDPQTGKVSKERRPIIHTLDLASNDLRDAKRLTGIQATYPA